MKYDGCSERYIRGLTTLAPLANSLSLKIVAETQPFAMASSSKFILLIMFAAMSGLSLAQVPRNRAIYKRHLDSVQLVQVERRVLRLIFPRISPLPLSF